MILRQAREGSLVERLVADELAQPVDARVDAMADAIARRHPGSLGVLFYGSCLRDATLSGMLDFYLIVEDYSRAYREAWLARANRLLPPNVFPFAHDGLVAKYAVLSLADLRRECGGDARDPSTFARFAQPSRLVRRRDEEASQDIARAVAQAPVTLLRLAAPLIPARDPLRVWTVAFERTYASELRAERAARPAAVVDGDRDRYRRLAEAVERETDLHWGRDPAAAERWWAAAARRGRRRQVAKLAKASLTYAGGIDYLAWKINRHAGTALAIRPWQRRHPLLGAVALLPRLLRRGAVR